jgi:hypothetical protein
MEESLENIVKSDTGDSNENLTITEETSNQGEAHETKQVDTGKESQGMESKVSEVTVNKDKVVKSKPGNIDPGKFDQFIIGKVTGKPAQPGPVVKPAKRKGVIDSNSKKIKSQIKKLKLDAK